MKKLCLLLIVVLLCLSGCDTYRYRNTYRVEFTQGELIEKSVLEDFEQIKSCSVLALKDLLIIMQFGHIRIGI